jgi:hypothetical protein
MSTKASAKIPAKPQKDTIYIEADDDITAIIEKIESAKNKVVALVLPKRSTSLQSIVNMRLLKRNADKAEKSVVLITSDGALLPLAGAAKLHVAKNLQSKPEIPSAPSGSAKNADEASDLPDDALGDEKPSTKLDYHRSVGELAAVAGVADGDEAIDLDDEDDSDDKKEEKKPKKEKTDKKLKVPNFDKFRAMFGLGGIALIGLVAFLVMAIWVWPKGVVTIQTESIPVSTEFSLKASDSAKALDMEKKIIPVATKTTQQTSTQQVTATGQQNNGDKATGSVTLKNCTDNAITVPAGTGVSSNGLTYILVSSVALSEGEFTSPGSGSVCKSSGGHVGSGSVKSQTGGSKYNIGPSNFSVAGFPGVTGSSSGAMSGGTDNITTVVAQSDLDKAKEKITATDTDAFTKKFEADQVKAGNYVLAATLKVNDPVVTSSPAVGQPANTVTVTIQITYTVQVVLKTDLEKAISVSLAKQINPKKQKLSAEDVTKDATVSVQNAASVNDITINVSQSLSAIPLLDTDAIKKQIGGLKTGVIKSSLSSLPGVKKVEVKFSPFWVSKAPKKPSKITVIVVPIKETTNKDSTSDEP